MVSNGIDARLSHLDDPDSPDAEVIGWVVMGPHSAPGIMHGEFRSLVLKSLEYVRMVEELFTWYFGIPWFCDSDQCFTTAVLTINLLVTNISPTIALGHT